MAYSEELAARIRDVVGGRDGITERRMFGGIAWMVSGNMVCGTLGEDLMVRLDPDDAERALDEPHVDPMDFTGRPMRGLVIVPGDGLDDDPLSAWVEEAVAFALAEPPKPPKAAKPRRAARASPDAGST